MTNSEKEQLQVNLMKAEQELKQKRFRFEVLAMAQEAAAQKARAVAGAEIDPDQVVTIAEKYMDFISAGTPSTEDTQKSMLIV